MGRKDKSISLQGLYQGVIAIAKFYTDLYNQPDYDIRSKEELLTLLKRYQPRGGLAVKALRESWPNVVPAIEELEKQGKVLVTRTGGNDEKEGVLKMVFFDELQKPERVDKGAWHLSSL